MADRKCSAITKNGEPCKAQPLKDADVCLAHADAATRESTGFVADNGKGGRPKNPRAVDVLKDKIEADVDKVLDPLWEALEADSGYVVGNGPSAELQMVADHRTRIAAARELLDRGYGKPKQQTEITGADSGPVEIISIVPLDAEERSAKAAALLKRHGHVTA